MLKKTKFIMGISLWVQSLTFIIIFFVLYSKKKSIAQTFLAIGALGGVAGSLLVYKQLKEEKEIKSILRSLDSISDLDEKPEIPIDDSASEEEFAD